GAIPPPAVGPTIAMQRLLQADNLRRSFDLLFLDISDRRLPNNIGHFDPVNMWLAVKHICQCLSILVLKRPAIVYLNLSQCAWGYLRDLGFIVAALLLQRRVVVHLRGSEFGSFYRAMPRLSRCLTRVVFKRISRVVVLGEPLKQVFDGLVDNNRIAVVRNGI